MEDARGKADKKVYQSEVIGKMGRGRPTMTWEKKVEKYEYERMAGRVRDVATPLLAGSSLVG